MDGIKLWQGPSELDGSEIMVIATGLKKASKNGKTGGMVQVWILPADVNPCEAVKSGEDESVCGDCPMRFGPCYVNVFHAPLAVYKCEKRNGYPVGAESCLEGFDLRLGGYGDPAAVPFEVWEYLLGGALGEINKWTGYTHQWKRWGFDPRVASVCMLSCDSPEDYWAAQVRGLRSFRIRLPEEPILPGEIVCPASKEGGHRCQCEGCGLCNGTKCGDRRKNIVIIAHGTDSKMKAYREMRLRVV